MYAGTGSRRAPGRWRAHLTVAMLLLASIFPAPARAADPDPWFGKDKVLHFGVSAGIAAGAYGVAATQFDARYPRLLIGGGVALAAGAGKELFDLAGFGDPSWRDFTWDVIGTAVGLGLAWGLDLVIGGVNDAHPLLGEPTLHTAAAQSPGVVHAEAPIAVGSSGLCLHF